MIKYILPLLLLPTTTLAEPDRVTLLLGSYHDSDYYEFEEFNPGVFLTWDNISVGAYRNSFGGPSVAAVYHWNFIEEDNWEVGVFGGIAYYPGYGQYHQYSYNDLIPMGGLQVTAGNLVMQLIPDNDYIVTFGITFELE